MRNIAYVFWGFGTLVAGFTMAHAFSEALESKFSGMAVGFAGMISCVLISVSYFVLHAIREHLK